MEERRLPAWAWLTEEGLVIDLDAVTTREICTTVDRRLIIEARAVAPAPRPAGRCRETA